MAQPFPAFIPTELVRADRGLAFTPGYACQSQGLCVPHDRDGALMATVPIQANRNGCSPGTDLVFQAGHNRRITVHVAQVTVREAETERFWYIFFVNGKYGINQAIGGMGNSKWKGTVLVTWARRCMYVNEMV